MSKSAQIWENWPNLRKLAQIYHILEDWPKLWRSGLDFEKNGLVLPRFGIIGPDWPRFRKLAKICRDLEKLSRFAEI